MSRATAAGSCWASREVSEALKMAAGLPNARSNLPAERAPSPGVSASANHPKYWSDSITYAGERTQRAALLSSMLINEWLLPAVRANGITGGRWNGQRQMQCFRILLEAVDFLRREEKLRPATFIGGRLRCEPGLEFIEFQRGDRARL